MSRSSAASIEIAAPELSGASDVLAPDALAFVADLAAGSTAPGWHIPISFRSHARGSIACSARNRTRRRCGACSRPRRGRHDYLHLRGLGTPAEGRAAARAGGHEEMRKIFLTHLTTRGAHEELAALTDLVRSGRRLALMCFEADPAHCHRRVVLECVLIHHDKRTRAASGLAHGNPCCRLEAARADGVVSSVACPQPRCRRTIPSRNRRTACRARR